MKTKLIPISENTVAKICYSIDTGISLCRTLRPDNFTMEITILKKVSSEKILVIVDKGLDIREKDSKVLEDLQAHIDTSDPVIGTVEINSVEFLSAKYFKTSFKLDRKETKNLLNELHSLCSSKEGYKEAIDLYNDLIAL